VSAGPARIAAVSSFVVERLVGFADLLRQRGLPVGAHELLEAMHVLRALGLAEPDSLYWGLRLAMVRDSRHLDAFDEAFRDYWLARVTEEVRAGPAPADERPGRAPAPRDESADGDGEEGASVGMPLGPSGPPVGDEEDEQEADLAPRAAYSDLDVLRRKDFADYTLEDHRALVELLMRFQTAGPWRLSRRKQRHRRGVVDIRRTVRAGFRTDGDPVRQYRRRPQPKHRRLTFVCDVSGSMEAYSRAVLELAHVALVSRRRVEAFAFATRVTRLTRHLVMRDTAAAVTAARESVVDWSGGTRVGDCMAELNRRHRAALQGAVVVIASDGWDLGDPELLAANAAHLQRVAHRVIWVNPRLQDPLFEPLTRGMSAALPYVDDFISCHDLASFLELIELLERA
jgi:uncharacterized protein with von Willebrand factor type A (vWA) domain